MKDIILIVALFVVLIAVTAVVMGSSDSWCVAGKMSGPCDEWPMKDVPESIKVHVK